MNLIKNYNKYRKAILNHVNYPDDFEDFEDCIYQTFKVENGDLIINDESDTPSKFKIVKEYPGDFLILFDLGEAHPLLLFRKIGRSV